MNISTSIRLALANKNKKAKDLAEGMGVKPQQISNWRKSGRMSADNIRAMAKFFDMSVSEFIALGE